MRQPRLLLLRQRQRGIALLTVLVLMLAVLMTGIASARGALQSARAAAHERDRVLAVQMADAALRDAQRDIEGGAEPGSARANAFLTGSADAFISGCGGGRPYSGLCAHVADPALTAELLAADDGPAVVFGSYTSSSMPDGVGGLAAQAPRYLIELMPAPPSGPPSRPGTEPPSAPAPAPPSAPEPASGPAPPATEPAPPGPEAPSGPAPPASEPPPSGQLYRITARGAGSMPGTHAALQAYYLKPANGTPGRRVGWREIGNWSELYAASASTANPSRLTGKDRR